MLLVLQQQSQSLRRHRYDSVFNFFRFRHLLSAFSGILIFAVLSSENDVLVFIVSKCYRHNSFFFTSTLLSLYIYRLTTSTSSPKNMVTALALLTRVVHRRRPQISFIHHEQLYTRTFYYSAHRFTTRLFSERENRSSIKKWAFVLMDMQ